MCKVTLGQRECDKLDWDSNFVPWKVKLHIFIEEVDIWEHVEKGLLQLIDLAYLVDHWNNESKVRESFLII